MMKNMLDPTPEYATSETVVWWDMDKCPPPTGYDPSLLGPRIDTELKKRGYDGPLTIIAFGDVSGIPYPFLRELSSSGVVIKHNLLGRMGIISDFEHWFNRRTSPVTVMFITEALLLSEVYTFLSERTGYNFLMAYTIENEPQARPLPVVVSGEWLWHRLGLLRESSSGSDTRRLDKGSEVFSCCACYNSCPDDYFTCVSFEDFLVHLDSSGHIENSTKEHNHKVICYTLRAQDEAEAIEANATRKTKKKSKTAHPEPQCG